MHYGMSDSTESGGQRRLLPHFAVQSDWFVDERCVSHRGAGRSKESSLGETWCVAGRAWRCRGVRVTCGPACRRERSHGMALPRSRVLPRAGKGKFWCSKRVPGADRSIHGHVAVGMAALAASSPFVASRPRVPGGDHPPALELGTLDAEAKAFFLAPSHELSPGQGRVGGVTEGDGCVCVCM